MGFKIMKYLDEDLQELSKFLQEQNYGGSTMLVTGATGLIGSLCIRALMAYNRTADKPICIIGLARNPEKVQAIFGDDVQTVRFLYQDIREPLNNEIKCDYIIHTANSTTSSYFITKPVEVVESIYQGTKQILDYGVRHRVKGIVYLSSMEAFGKVDSNERIGEEHLGYIDLQNIRSCYSEGKRMAELMCKCYAEEFGLSVCIARLAQTFGAGIPITEERVFAQFARSAIRGEDVVLHTRGQSVGNYCYTADVVRAIFLLMKKGKSGDVYTVVNEETTRTIAEMAQMVVEQFSNGKSSVVFDIPKDNKFGYAPETKLRLSSRKLNELGWHATYGLREMYERMIPDLM